MPQCHILVIVNSRFLRQLLALIYVLLLNGASAQIPGDLPWTAGNIGGQSTILDEGIVAMACGTSTSLSAATQYTFGLADPRSATYSTSAATPSMWHHADWILNDIGNIQGVAIDDEGNLYLTASAHNSPAWDEHPSPGWRYGDIGGGADSLLAAGTIYKVDAVTGAPSVFAQLPQQSTSITIDVAFRGNSPVTRTTGPGLFGIAYDWLHDQFYVANIEDGRIYIVESDGSFTASDAFDPLTADTGAAGPAPMGQRVMAVEAYEDRVYYSIRDDSGNNTIVRSVSIDASGKFDASSDQSEVNANIAQGTATGYAAVVTDIEFSADGKMALGCATYYEPNPFSHVNHGAGNLVYTGDSGSWTLEKAYDPSTLGGGTPEAYGGVDWGDYQGASEALLWSSSADMITSSSSSSDEHGLIAYPYASLPTNTSSSGGPNYIWFEYDPTFGDYKGIGNDVEIYRAIDADLGDALDLSQGTSAASPRDYQTTSSDDGPAHLVGGAIYMGATIDADDGTQQNAAADADGSDEDGVTFSSSLYSNASTYSVDVSITNPLTPSVTTVAEDNFNTETFTGGTGWVDASWTQSGSFVWDSGAFCVSGSTAPNGHIERTFPVPSGISNLTLFFDSALYSPSPSWPVDFDVLIDGVKIADITAAGSQSIDLFPHVTPGNNSVVRFERTLSGPNCIDNIVISYSNPGTPENIHLVGWIDFDQSGSFDADEAATLSGAVTGSQTLNWTSIPSDTIGGATYARFRISTESLTANDSTGRIGDGEVEDYLLTILDPIGAIGNIVWLDENSDGYQDVGEPGIPNITVQLWLDEDGGGRDTLAATKITDAHGGYLFPDLPAGCYYVDILDSTVPSSLSQTTAYTNVSDGADADSDNDDGDFGNKDHTGDGYKITLDASETNLTADFGYNENPTTDVDNGTNTAAIGDKVWFDTVGDGAKAPEELGIAGVTVELVTTGPDGLFHTADDVAGVGSDGVLGTGDDVAAFLTTTDSNGCYLFDGLTPDAYCVKIVNENFASGGALEGLTQTGDPDHFGGPKGAGAPNDDNETTVPVILGPGDVFLNADFGYRTDPASLGSIGDKVWLDTDASGGDESTKGSEPGIAGVTVALIGDTNKDGDWDSGEPIIATDVTDSAGCYLFQGLPVDADGEGYLVWVNDTENVLQGLTQTYDEDGVLDDLSGAVLSTSTLGSLTEDFSYTHRTPVGSIGDTVWADLDSSGGNQSTQGGEPGIAGVTINLCDAAGNVITSTVTNAAGEYLFSNLAFATYTVKVDTADTDLTTNYATTPTYDPQGAIDSQATITLSASNPHDRDQDFSYPPNVSNTLSSIGDKVYYDTNGDGSQDVDGADNTLGTADDEPGIPGIVIDLGGAATSSTTTDENGCYLFDDLAPGTYTITVNNPPSGTTQTEDPDGGADDTSSKTLGASEHDRAQDFGYDPTATLFSIGNTVWLDLDGDGVEADDPNEGGSEPGIEGVTVYLCTKGADNTFGTADDVQVASATTDSTGYYQFNGLAGAVDYRVKVDTSTLPAAVSPVSTFERDGTTNNYSDLINLGSHITTEDFAYPLLGAIGDTVFFDADDDDTPDPGEGIGGVLVRLCDSGGTVTLAETTTDANGRYLFDDLAAGTYTVKVDPNDSLPATFFNTEDPDTDPDTSASPGDETSSVTLGVAEVDLAQDFGYQGASGLGSIGTIVWEDHNADGDHDGANGPDGLASTDDDEPSIAGITLDLFWDQNGDCQLDPGEPKLGTATTTGSSSDNYLFDNLPVDDGGGDMSYIVKVTDTAGILNGYWKSLDPSYDNDGDSTNDSDNTSKPDHYCVTLSTSRPDEVNADFGYYVDFACVGNRVWIDTNDDGDQDSGELGLNGVTMQLDITFANSDTITLKTLTADESGTSNAGHYEFCGLLADEDYRTGSSTGTATSTQPDHEISVSAIPSAYVKGKEDEPGAANDQVDGDLHAGVTAVPTQGHEALAQATSAPDNEADPIASYDFAVTKVAADTWAGFLSAFGLTGDDALPQPTGALPEAGNPDKDIYDNLLEYAFCLHPNNLIPAYDPFCIEINAGTTPDSFEAVFRRPAGGLTDVTYCLQGRSTLPVSFLDTWTDLKTVPGDGAPGSGVTVTPMGDGTEEVRIADITVIASTGDTLLGFEDTLARGFVRLAVKLDTDGGGTDFTSYTQVQGWKQTDFTENQCETYSYPWLKKETFSGSIASVSGQDATITGTPDLSSALTSGTSYYMEIISGDNEGHRYDIVSANASGVITLATDSDLCAGPPYNTTTSVPTNLAEDRFIVRPHQTIDDVFPVSGFTAESDSSMADRLLIHTGGTPPWTNFYVDDPAEWKNETSGASASNDVLAPEQGLFVHPQATSGTTSILAMGIVRENAFCLPLNGGYTLVAGGYPLDQSFDDRGLDGTTNNVTGSLDPSFADQIHFWDGDTNPYQESFGCYFRIEGTITELPTFNQWSDVEDADLTNASTNKVFICDRAAFYYRTSSTCYAEHKLPLPWMP